MKTAVNVSLHSLALNIFTISDGSPAAFEFPEVRESFALIHHFGC
jgi:hypothetical protein